MGQSGGGEYDMFRILSLDGGGIKGTFTASVLASLEADTGKSCADHFDLIAGTSTGGILALGLGLRFPAAELLNFYRDRGPQIFPSTGLIERKGGIFRQLFRPKHSSGVLREELEVILGSKKLGESACRLVIPAYDAVGGRIFILKTAHHERFKYDHNALAVDVALATSAAPTYFAQSPFPEHSNATYVDGGVWANSPVLVALTEAVHFLGVPLDDIDMLSIGTTAEPFSIAQHATSGAARWNAGLIDLMFEAQMEAAVAQAKLLLRGRLHRINYVAEPGQFSLDDARPEKISQLEILGQGEARKVENLDVVKLRFLNVDRVEPFDPFHITTKQNAAADT